MLVTYHCRTKDGNVFKLDQRVTIKKAKAYFNKSDKNDDSIIKVWLTHFGTWHEYHYKTLKDIQ